MTLSRNAKGYVEVPQYPCIKGDGLCKLRTIEEVKFDCVFSYENCRSRVLKTIELDKSNKSAMIIET